MARVFLWKRHPKNNESMRKKIARSLGTTENGYVDVVDKKGSKVRVTVDNVFDHNWIKHPDRWAQVPLIKWAIKNAVRLTADKSPGRQFYSSTLIVGHRGKEGIQKEFITRVKKDPVPTGIIYWLSGHVIRRNQLNRYEKELGPPTWETLSRAETRNPTPAPPHSDVLRSGRTPKAYDYHTTQTSEKSRQLAWLTFGIVGMYILNQVVKELPPWQNAPIAESLQ